MKQRFDRYALTSVMSDADKITAIVVNALGTDLDTIRTSSRKQMFVKARRVLIYFLYSYTILTLTEIGQYLGYVDHSTAYTHWEKAASYMSYDHLFANEPEAFLLKKIKNILDKELNNG